MQMQSAGAEIILGKKYFDRRTRHATLFFFYENGLKRAFTNSSEVVGSRECLSNLLDVIKI